MPSARPPSEPNYVAILGGNDFGLSSDDPYYFPGNSVDEPNLMSELDAAGLTWKGYYQGMPYDGYRGYCFPAKCNGIPDADTQYVVKHNGIPFFQNMQTPAEFAKEQPYSSLAADLASGNVPNVSYIVPDECDDMHGAPPRCVDSDNPGTVDDNWLVANGDKFVGHTVNAITSSTAWKSGNNAIVITWDEGNFATDQIVAIVITNHGPRQFSDNTNYNHYSLSASLTDAYGLPCLGAEAPHPNGDGCSATPMTPLFSTTGRATTPPLPLPYVPPANTTPQPKTSPVQGPPVALGAGGWNPVASPDLTTDDDNVLASVSAASRTDAWAVGNYYPDVSDTEATVTGPILQTLGEHWNGTNWTAYPLPNVGNNENSLLSVSQLRRGKAWAVGYYIDSGYAQKALVEHYDGHDWDIVPAPNPGTEGNILYSVAAVRDNDVWAVGGERDDRGVWHPLVEHWNGNRWKVGLFPTTSSSGSELLYAVSAVSSSSVYVIGQDGISFPERMVIGHFDGNRWSLLKSPNDSSESLDPLVEHRTNGQWSIDTTPDMTDFATDGGDNGFAGIAAIPGGGLWAVGLQTIASTGATQTLIEYHP